MRRKSLSLLLIAPILLVLLLTQLADVQAARPLPINQEPVVDEGASGVPLAQPLSIRIRQQIPISVPYVLFAATPLTAALPAAVEPIPAPSLAAGEAATEVVSLADAVAALGQGVITETAPLTSEAIPLTEVVVPGAADEVTPTEAITLGEALTVTAVPVAIPEGTTEGTAEGTSEGASASSTGESGASEEDAAALGLETTAAPPTATEVVSPAIVPLIAIPGAALPDTTSITATTPLTDLLATPSIFLASDLTSTPGVLPTLGLTLDLDIQVLVTDTMTSTVPATVIVRITGMPTFTVPITLALSPPPDTALVYVEAVTPTEALTIPTLSLTPGVTVTESLTVTPPLTESAETTSTEGLTMTEGVTEVVTPTPTVPAALTVVTFTVPLTTNVRLTPSVDGEIVRRASPDEIFQFVAQNAAGDWYLLREGNWVAQIALGEPLTGLPTASDDLIAALRSEAASATPTPVPTPGPTLEPTATPTVAPFTPVTVTTTTNANLRAGPGTTFDIAGNTEFGQAVVVVARNDAGDWLRLQDGSWISAPLVQGAPPLASIPAFDPNATPTPAPTPTPLAETVAPPEAEATPEATPSTGGASLPTPTPRQPTLTVDENLYLVDFDSISSNYDRALTAVDRLVDSASGNAAVLSDAQWQTDMNTAIQLIRRAGQDVAGLVVPERFAAAHNSLVAAATQYNTAADALAAGLQQTDLTQFERAFAAIGLGDASMAQAAAALNAFRP